jgi:hypothetical protein
MAAIDSGPVTGVASQHAGGAAAVPTSSVPTADRVDRRPARREPRPWETLLALMPAMLVFGLWVHSARYPSSYTWHPEPHVSRTIASTNGVIRLAQNINPGYDTMEMKVQRGFLGFTYHYLEADDGRMKIESLVIPYWAPLVLSAIPAALVARRRRAFEE